MNFFATPFCFLFVFWRAEAFAPSPKVTASQFFQIIIDNCVNDNQNQNVYLHQNPLFASSDENDNSSDGNLGAIQSIVGLTDAELKRIVSRVPELSGYSSAVARVCAEELQTRLSLTEIEFKKKIVLRLPQCLGYDFDTDIGPGLSQLQSYLDMSDYELRSLVLKCPQIIGLDFSSDVEPKIRALREAIREQGDDGDGGVICVDIESLKEEILKKPGSLDLAVRGGVSTSKKM